MHTELNILVVDDIENNLIAAQALLARPGLQVLTATSGEQALELLLRHEVALALVDVQMPGMDGFELAELIRGTERTRSIPLIFLTAATNDPKRTFRGYEAGAVDFLHKPFEPHILRSKVEVFVELYAQKRQLAEQLEELRHALHMNEVFTAVLSHDLRNPLSGIAFATEVILRCSQDEKVTAAAARIKSSGLRMSRMIVQLLDLARIRSTGLELEPHDADMMELCQTIRNELHASEEPNRVLVEARGDTLGTFDSDRISQVLSNLIGNAVRHGSTDEMIRIVVDGEHEDWLTVSVWNGGAIPADAQAQVFQPFHRTQGQVGRSDGLGLGLYIVERFVTCHGGSVSVHSTEEDGTTFSFSIPRKQDASTPLAVEMSSAAA